MSSAAYDNMTLAAQAKHESQDLSKYDEHVRYIASRFSRSGCATTRELVQEGRVALWEVSRTFVSVNGANLWTYAERFVRKAMLRYVTDRHAVRDLDESGLRLEADASIEPDERAATSQALARLDERSRCIVCGRLAGERFEDIARSLGIGEATAVRIHQAALAALKNDLT